MNMRFGHDVDVPVPADMAPAAGGGDPVLAQLCQLTYFVQDIRNLLAAGLGDQMAPARETAGSGPAGVSDPPPESSPSAGRPTSELLTAAAQIIGSISFENGYAYRPLLHELCERAATFRNIEQDK